jgi:hypothetical protein
MSGLLAEIDKLASRVDQLREPVSGDEVLPILQRRLLEPLLMFLRPPKYPQRIRKW